MKKPASEISAAEAGFLEKLEAIAQEQRKLSGTEIMPRWAVGIGEWLVVHPWRVLVPLAGILYIVFRMILGTGFRELILALFGGF